MPHRHLTTPRAVSEHLLRVTAHALMTKDFDTFAACFRLPQKMTTAGTQVVVKCIDDFRTCFDQFCALLDESGVTELYRECIAAEFKGRDRVEATHISYVRRDGVNIVTPYPVFSVLEREGNRWVITSSDYMLDDDQPLARAILSFEDSDLSAVKIYQEHLDVLSQALLEADFETFANRISLPHRITTQTDVIEIKTRDEMEKTFHRFAAGYRDSGLTDFVRVAENAKFVSPDEIIGRHVSHQMTGERRMVPPYPNRVRLVRDPDNTWRETHCANAILNTSDNFHHWTRLAENPTVPALGGNRERT